MSPIKTEKRLSQKCMLVTLNITSYSGRTKDRQVTEEVTQAKHAEQDTGAWWTYLIPRKALLGVTSKEMSCRNQFYKLTLPWNDGGSRILPTEMFMDFSKAMREAKEAYEKAVEDFVSDYPSIVEQAKTRLGKLAENKRMPTASEIKSKFAVRYDIFPLPDTKDFRVDLAENEADIIKKQMQQSINSMMSKATNSIWEQLNLLVSKIEQTMGDNKKIFRDSLISNLKDFCKLIPKLNLTNDSNLNAIAEEVKIKLAKLQPDELRESKHTRKAAHKAAQDVLEKMKGYINK